MIIDMPTVSMGNSGSILPAEQVSYDNTSSGLEAENVQDAIDEVNSNLTHSNDYNLNQPALVGKYIDGNTEKNVYRIFLNMTGTATRNAFTTINVLSSNIGIPLRATLFTLDENMKVFQAVDVLVNASQENVRVFNPLYGSDINYNRIMIEYAF